MEGEEKKEAGFEELKASVDGLLEQFKGFLESMRLLNEVGKELTTAVEQHDKMIKALGARLDTLEKKRSNETEKIEKSLEKFDETGKKINALGTQLVGIEKGRKDAEEKLVRISERAESMVAKAMSMMEEVERLSAVARSKKQKAEDSAKKEAVAG